MCVYVYIYTIEPAVLGSVSSRFVDIFDDLQHDLVTCSTIYWDDDPQRLIFLEGEVQPPVVMMFSVSLVAGRWWCRVFQHLVLGHGFQMALADHFMKPWR